MPAFERRRWGFRGAAARALAVLREEGPLALVDRGLSQLGVHRLLVLEQRLDPAVAAASPVRTRSPSASALAFGEAGEADLEPLAELRAAEHDELTAALKRPREPVQALLRRQLVHGDRCFVARAGPRIVGVLWVSRGEQKVRYLLCDLLLSANDAYVYDVFVAPDARGRGLATALYGYVAAALAEGGWSRAVMRVRVHNAANLAAAAHAGYRRAGVLTCMAARGRTLHLGHALATRPWSRE